MLQPASQPARQPLGCVTGPDLHLSCNERADATHVCVCVCRCAYIRSIQEAENKAAEASMKINCEEQEREENRDVCCWREHTSHKLVPRLVWDHNFSIQPEVKLGSSSIDFFPGFVAVFLSTNSKCRPSPALDVISV